MPAPGFASSLDRRRFLTETARMAAGCAVAGTLLGSFVNRAGALPAEALRPPGALSEADFLAACSRCGLCVRDCPYDTLSLAVPGEDVATGTPFFTAREIPCEMCEDIPCVAACPTGALDPGLTDIGKAKMGVAVLVDEEHCLNALGLRCDVCYRVCPVIDQAITLEMRHNPRSGHHAIFLPVVHAEFCTGCGKCEKSCVLPEATIKVLPLPLGRGVASDHYRLGWREMQDKGGPIVEGIVDLPDRLPGPGTDNLATPGGFAPEGTGDFAPAFKLPGGKP